MTSRQKQGGRDLRRAATPYAVPQSPPSVSRGCMPDRSRTSRRKPCIHGRSTLQVLTGAWLLVGTLIPGCGPSIPTLRHDGTHVSITPLGGGVNTRGEEYAPQPAADGTGLYFTSKRTTPTEPEDSDKLFHATLDGVTVRGVERVSTGVEAGLSEGAPSFDHANGVVYFSQCYRPDGVGDCDLYTAEIRDGRWSAVRNPGPGLNSKDWDSHPAISPDGRTLYFASERMGGRGGSDLWKSERGKDGTWGPPVNLGEPINTPGDEKAPYMASDGVSLYFSSDYHAGFGDFDLFVSEWKHSAWTTPLNLGRPYNSDADDLFIVTRADGDTVFFASNRSGGAGGFDLYGAVRSIVEKPVSPPPPPIPPAPPVPKEPLAVRFVTLNAFTLRPVAAVIALTPAQGEETLMWTDERGEGRVDAEPGRSYRALVSRSGFVSTEDVFTYPDSAYGERRREVLLTPVIERERTLYAFVVEFDFNYSNIRPSERENLDSVVTLLARFPNSTVVVAGHTDSVGTDMYNIRLGYSRAREVSTYVERYLREQGAVLMHPMEIRTYGKTMPIAPNDTEEGRQRNRRVEISIVRNE